jgi:DNA-binding NtrC family response regulator
MFHIIDDEAMLREVTSAMLIDYGYDVLCFESGAQYLEYLKSPNFIEPTAVLSDVTMPGINSYDLALEIRKALPFQKIILITGNPDSKHHKKAAQQICFTLNKPFNPEKFLAMVGSVSNCHQLHLTNQQQPYPQKCSIDSLFNCPFAYHD